jgi:hypothetical protein
MQIAHVNRQDGDFSFEQKHDQNRWMFRQVIILFVECNFSKLLRFISNTYLSGGHWNVGIN